ncbi:MAG: 3-hydroxyacyl-ACP dehydratase [Gammaproteobacteria bacterium]|nr:3-hydroxyacyl-ACP dehydratase [Gammaproteobacteria bacterium]
MARIEDCVGMPISEFLMHRDPMLLLDALVECEGERTVCVWRVNPDDSFVEPGNGVPAYVGVEFMAQCVAVHAGVRARVEGFGPPLGFLLGTRQFSAKVTHFEIGETYRATCEELIRDSSGMGSYECSVLHGESVVATARLAVLEKERGNKLQ